MRCKNYGVLCTNRAYANAVNAWQYCKKCLQHNAYMELKKWDESGTRKTKQ
jgi:hypothetical protein